MMNENSVPRRIKPEFTSSMTERERLAALIYLPVHMLVLPVLATKVLLKNLETLSPVTVNFVYYAVGFTLMVALEFRFLRREFAALRARPGRCLATVALGYLMMYGLDYVVMSVMMAVRGLDAINMSFENPNNSAVFGMFGDQRVIGTVMIVFLAPVLEELLFRGGLFGTLRHRNRLLAYIVTIFVFSMYHVWQGMSIDWRNLIYLVQYIPVSFVLCWAYERTDTIWTPIGLHILINSLSLVLMQLLQQLQQLEALL